MAVLNWFNEDSEQYKFIKKALEDVDEVDRIDVLASDEVANHTETPDVGPNTSLTPPVHTRCGLAPISYLATETPNPPFMTQPGPQCHPSLPLTPKLPCGLPMLDLSPPYTSLLLTITHPRPHPIAPPRQLYPPLALKHPKLKVCLPARVIHNCLIPPLP